MGTVVEARRAVGPSSAAVPVPVVPVASSKRAAAKRRLVRPQSISPAFEDEAVCGWDDGLETLVADDVDLAKWDSLSQPSRLAWLEQCGEGSAFPSCLLLGHTSEDEEAAPAAVDEGPQGSPKQSQMFNFAGTVHMPQREQTPKPGAAPAELAESSASQAPPSTQPQQPAARRTCTSAPAMPVAVLGLTTIDIVAALSWDGNYEKVVARRCLDSDDPDDPGAPHGSGRMLRDGPVRSPRAQPRQVPSSAPVDGARPVLPYKFKYMRRVPDPSPAVPPPAVAVVVGSPPSHHEHHSLLAAAIAAAGASPIQSVALPTSMFLQYSPVVNSGGTVAARFLGHPLLTESAIEARKALAPRHENTAPRGFTADAAKASGLPPAQAATSKNRHRMTYTVARGDDSEGEGAIAYKGGALYGESARGGWEAKVSVNAPLAIVHEGDKTKGRKVGVMFPSVQMRNGSLVTAAASPPRASSIIFPPQQAASTLGEGVATAAPPPAPPPAVTKHASKDRESASPRAKGEHAGPPRVASVRLELSDTMPPVACGKNLGTIHTQRP